MSVSIVMPCYNEANIIEKVATSYYNTIIPKIENSEFIIIDDFSTDGTYDILRNLEQKFDGLKVVRNPINMGHGRTVRYAYETAAKEWVFQVDSDDQFDPEDFWKLYTFKGDCDFIAGFRKERKDPLARQILSWIIKIAILLIFGMRIKDANCPFRLIKNNILKNLLNNIDKEAIAPNIMLSILARRSGLRTKEVAINHYQRQKGTSSLIGIGLVKFSFRGFWQLLLFRLRYTKGSK